MQHLGKDPLGFEMALQQNRNRIGVTMSGAF
jgi:hypothetical protein